LGARGGAKTLSSFRPPPSIEKKTRSVLKRFFPPSLSFRFLFVVFGAGLGVAIAMRSFFRSWRSFLLLVVLFLALLAFAFAVPACLVFCLGFSCCLVIDLLVEDYLFIGK